MVRVQKEEIRSGWIKGRMFVYEGGAGVLHWLRGQDGAG